MTISQDAGTDASAAPAQPAGRFSASRIRIRVGFLVVPALLFLTVFYLYPLFRLISQSVEGTNLSLEHYITFFTDSLYLSVLMRTMIMSASTTLICLLLGYPVAYFLTKVKGSARNLIFLLIIVPYLTSFLVRTYAWLIILNNRGIANGILTGTGIVDEPVQLLYNKIGVYIGMVHIMLPFMILPLYAVMQGIDRRLVRAAHSLGSSPVGAFFKVFLPLSLPGVQSGCLLVFLITLGFYITPALLGGLGDMMLVNMIDIQVERLGNWGFASAASVILLLVTLGGFFLIGRASGSADVFSLDAVGSRPAPAAAGSSPISRARSAFGKLLVGLLTITGIRALSGTIAAHIAARRLARFKKMTRPPRRSGNLILGLVVGIVLFFLVAPTLVVIPMSFNSANFLTFPPPGFSLRWYSEVFSGQGWMEGLLLSFKVGLLTMALSTVLGTLAAFALVRGRFAYRRALMGLIVSPIIVPPVVLGTGIYGLFVTLGMLGSVWGLVLAHSTGAMVFVVVVVASNLSRFDTSLERAAMSMGAGPLRTFFFVTFPLIRPGILAGAVFAFIHSFDELVIAKLISGISSKTLPVRMFQNLRNEIDPTIAAISSLLLLLPIIALVLLEFSRRRSGRRELG